ncbi:MAG: flagellin, partial [Geobacteraceae bacterium]|nr:flagellin [Geobacteraceae bacterium]
TTASPQFQHTDITAIASGGYQAAALRSDGTVVAFGSDNAYDQLAVPTGLTGVTSLAAGPDFTLALKSDGTVVGWGTNYSDQINIPADLSGVVAISAGSGYALALKNDGSIVGWGSNSSGMLTPQTGMDVGNAWATTAGIQNSMDQVDSAVSTMRSTSKSLSSNSNVLTTRLDFTDSMMNILQTGADNLTLADMNDEGASMLMLQTRQQIAVSSLSMASQASQSVMRLFG